MNLRTCNPNDEGFETAMAVLESEIATIGQLRQANEWCNEHRPQIGMLAIAQDMLTPAQLSDILCQQTVSGELFGQAAMKMGYLSLSDLDELIRLQLDLTPTLADSLIALDVITPEICASILKRSPRPAPATSAPMLLEPAGN